MQIIKLLPCVLIAGCASSNWYLNGRSQQEFQRHDMECQQYAKSAMDQQSAGQSAHTAGYGAGSGNAALAGVGFAGLLVQQSAYNGAYAKCMNYYGYTKAP
jgi:hypothetical protein